MNPYLPLIDQWEARILAEAGAKILLPMCYECLTDIILIRQLIVSRIRCEGFNRFIKKTSKIGLVDILGAVARIFLTCIKAE